MKVTVEELSSVKRALHIELPPERVADRLEAAFRELRQNLQLPGFRKGKVPQEIVRRRFQENVKDEVLRELIPDSYREALTQTTLQPVSQPQVDEVHFEEGQPLTYRAVIEVKPPIQVENYRGMTLSREKVEIPEQEVDRALEYLREEAAEYVPMEGWPALRDDLVLLDHVGSIRGRPFKGGSGKNLALILGREGYLPGFAEQIAGMKKGEGKQFSLTFPEDFARKDLAGRAAEFQVSVKEVKKRRLPELNDEFAKTAADVESLAALREKLKEQLQQRKQRDQEGELKRQLLEKLVASHPVDVPEALIDAEAASVLEEMAMTIRASGGRVQGLPENAEALRAKAREAGQRRAKESLLLEAVAKQEGLAVSEEEMQAEIDAAARVYRQDAAAARRAFEDPARRAGLAARILERKALDFLYQQATITDTFHLITPA